MRIGTSLGILGATILIMITANNSRSEDGDLFGPVRAALKERRTELSAGAGKNGATLTPLEIARGLHEVGKPREAAEELVDADFGQTEAARLGFELYLDLHEFERARGLVETLDLEVPADRKLWYQWWFVLEDLAAVDSEVRDRLRHDPDSVVDRLAAGRLRLALLDRSEAQMHYERALEIAQADQDRAAARRGLSGVSYRRREFDASLVHLQAALDLTPLDSDLLQQLNGTLIRLGRTEEAIEAVELAVEISPLHEAAHYMLGNGYARKNYTQLFEAYPDAFADESGRVALAEADSKLANGDPAAARNALEALHSGHPEWVDVLVRLGSLEFSQSRHREARDLFQSALDVCPEYGRAHNGLAKALEAGRLELEIHRSDYERAFADTPMPQVPRIEEFVLNWEALSARHQKQVALSIEPWSRYLPVLIAGGLTYYIKPLHELLSETPGQETLRDLRISYDSRLWDDVRGCGGYHTVTGIEDVERTVLGRYNTVLHELTHQVHGVLPSESSRQIQELYRVTKERDEETGDAFLSRYAGGSVWEYFAEGANSWKSPRRDRYDTREIVLERLIEMDPELKALVIDLATVADVAPCYPVAYVGKGYQELEDANPSGAIASYKRALEFDETEPNAISALVYALQLTGESKEAITWADRGTGAHPEDGSLATTQAGARWHAGIGLQSAIRSLEEARKAVREEDLYRVDLELGRLHWVAGNAKDAGAAYDRVLEYQSDSPEGLWGRAMSAALGEDWSEAWVDYEEAVRHRTGIVGLRCDYARDLIRAGEMDSAREQIDAALLLDAGAPEARALDAWWALEHSDHEDALSRAAATREEFPWCSLARMVEAKARAELGSPEAGRDLLEPLRSRVREDAPPRYVFREKWGRYDEVETHPAVERQLLESTFRVE